MADPGDSSPLIARVPAPEPKPSEIDLEAGPNDQFQCRICFETDGRDFIAPCKCKGTSKYVHRECLDHWRAVRFAIRLNMCLNEYPYISTYITWKPSSGGRHLWNTALKEYNDCVDHVPLR